jgi:hypothetical protein
MATQECVGVTQKCVAWRMGEIGSIEEFFSARRDKGRRFDLVPVARYWVRFMVP